MRMSEPSDSGVASPPEQRMTIKLAADLDFVDGADIGMVERRGGPGFVQQKFCGGGVGRGVFGDDFDGPVALEHLVARAVDGAHAAFAELGEDAIVPEHVVDHECA